QITPNWQAVPVWRDPTLRPKRTPPHSERALGVDAQRVAHELRTGRAAGGCLIVLREARVGDVHLAEPEHVAPDVAVVRRRRSRHRTEPGDVPSGELLRSIRVRGDA